VSTWYSGTPGGGPRKSMRATTWCVWTLPVRFPPRARGNRLLATTATAPLGCLARRCVWGGGPPGMYVTKFSTATLVARVRLQPSFVSRRRRRRRRASSYHFAVFLSRTPPSFKPTSLIIKIPRFHGKIFWFRNSLVRV